MAATGWDQVVERMREIERRSATRRTRRAEDVFAEGDLVGVLAVAVVMFAFGFTVGKWIF